jgi:hypothetical protein
LVAVPRTLVPVTKRSNPHETLRDFVLPDEGRPDRT